MRARRLFRLRWPERTYLFSARHKFLYCPIPKVAMTSLKTWTLQVAGASPDEIRNDISSTVRRHVGIDALSRREARAVLQDPEYFRFAIVRDPWDRLVSAYLNKFPSGRRPSVEMVEAAQRLRGRVDRDAGISFREFVEFLATRRLRAENRHWRPQHLFLGDYDFDFVGKIERLEEDFAEIGRRLGIDRPLPARNRTSYAAAADSNECLADWDLARLRTLSAFPPPRRFYTRDLVDLVGELYAEDVRRFDYEPPDLD